MIKHTPGPWQIVMPKTSRGRHILIWGIATMSYNPNDDVEKVLQRVADARLVAAAPDLLAALRMLDVQGLFETEDRSLDPYIEQARAAIRKAERGGS